MVQQSIANNKELLTVNHQSQTKVDELSRASSDRKNLRDRTDIAPMFLGRDRNVRIPLPPGVKAHHRKDL